MSATPGRAGWGRRAMAVAIAIAWVLGSAYVALDLHAPGAWILPALVAAASACCLALSRWPQARAARWLQAALWVPLFCLAAVPPLYTAIATTANALFPDRFMCADGERMVRCGMIGIEVLWVPVLVFAVAIVCRVWWREVAVERVAAGLATAIASLWLAAALL